MSFRFSILRMLLVVAIFAAAAAAFVKLLGLWGIPVAISVAIPPSGIALLAKSGDAALIFRSVVFCGLGAFVGLLFCPAIHPPYEPGDEFRYMIVGSIIGWISGFYICPCVPQDGFSKGTPEIHEENRKQ